MSRIGPTLEQVREKIEELHAEVKRLMEANEVEKASKLMERAARLENLIGKRDVSEVDYIN